MTTGICDFQGGCQAPEHRCWICKDEEIMTDNYKMNRMLEDAGMLSDEGKKELEFGDWFTRGHQKQIIFKIASEMYLDKVGNNFTHHDPESIAERCVELAETFVDKFYEIKVNPRTRR